MDELLSGNTNGFQLKSQKMESQQQSLNYSSLMSSSLPLKSFARTFGMYSFIFLSSFWLLMKHIDWRTNRQRLYNTWRCILAFESYYSQVLLCRITLKRYSHWWTTLSHSNFTMKKSSWNSLEILQQQQKLKIWRIFYDNISWEDLKKTLRSLFLTNWKR